MIPIWLQLKLEMEISKLKKDLKDKDNVIEEKEEEMYLLNEKLEQQQVNNPNPQPPTPTPNPPPPTHHAPIIHYIVSLHNHVYISQRGEREGNVPP